MGKSDLSEVIDILKEYSSDIQEGITDTAISVAKDGVKTLKATSPVNKKRTAHRGSYARGWRTRTEKSYGSVNVIIHNATDYQLTHLLEKPHLKRNTKLGKTKPIVHIQPVDATCSAEYERKVEEVIRNA